MMNDSLDGTMEDWVKRYYRKLLDFMKAPADVDLYTVRVRNEYEPAYAYSEYTAENAYFQVHVYWKSPSSGYEQSAVLCNDDVIDFLNSLT